MDGRVARRGPRLSRRVRRGRRAAGQRHRGLGRHGPDRRGRHRLVRRHRLPAARMKRLLLAGGGHAHVEVLRELAERPDDNIEVTLVTPYPWLTYSGMVPGLMAGHYELDDCTIDLIALAGRAR